MQQAEPETALEQPLDWQFDLDLGVEYVQTESELQGVGTHLAPMLRLGPYFGLGAFLNLAELRASGYLVNSEQFRYSSTLMAYGAAIRGTLPIGARFELELEHDIGVVVRLRREAVAAFVCSDVDSNIWLRLGLGGRYALDRAWSLGAQAFAQLRSEECFLPAASQSAFAPQQELSENPAFGARATLSYTWDL